LVSIVPSGMSLTALVPVMSLNGQKSVGCSADIAAIYDE